MSGDLSPHFNRAEFACRDGCGFDTVDSELLLALEQIRMHFNAPIIITSGCRCQQHNDTVGGSKTSQHLYGRAADFKVKGVPLMEVRNYAEKILDGEGGLGYYPRENGGWLHLDTRTNGGARWNG